MQTKVTEVKRPAYNETAARERGALQSALLVSRPQPLSPTACAAFSFSTCLQKEKEGESPLVAP